VRRCIFQTVDALARAYGALEAGKLPSAQQTDKLLRRLLNSSLLQPEIGSRWAGRAGGGQLSPAGKDVVLAGRGVVQAIARLNLEKNEDNKIQKFVYSVRKAAVQDQLEVQIELPDLDLPTTDELSVAGESLSSLGNLFVTSSQLRNSIADLTTLLSDIFDKTTDELIKSADEVARASNTAAQKQQAAKQVGKRKARQLREFIEDQNLEADLKDELIERFKAIANEIQSKEEYTDAVSTLTDVARKYAKAGQNVVKEAIDQTEVDAEAGPQVHDSAYLLKDIITAFTGPLDGVFDAAKKLTDDVEKDPTVKKLVDDLQDALDRVLYSDPAYLTSSKNQRRLEQLYDRAQQVSQNNQKFKADASAVAKELNKALDKARNDKALDSLSKAMAKLQHKTERFFNKGYSLFDGTGVWSDLSQVLIPRLLGALKSVPLPRVEYTSADIDVVLDGIDFTSASFVPHSATFKNHNEATVKRGYAAYATEFSTSTNIHVKGIQLEAQNISYYINKKTGWIGLEDSGLIDLKIGTPNNEHATDGLAICLTIENAKNDDNESYFVLKKVDVDVTNFSLKIHGSQSPVRAWLGQSAVRAAAEHLLKEGLEQQIGDMFVSLDQKAWALQQRAIGAGYAAPDPLSFVKALLAPTPTLGGREFELAPSHKGLTKVGPNGDSILAIGVDELLLPGKLTALGRKGKDVVHKRQSAERELEEGRRLLEEAEHEAEEAAEEARDEAQDQQEREGEGWESDAFDLLV